jgi:hypothetical protein
MTFYHLQLGGFGLWGDAAAFAFYRGLKTDRVPDRSVPTPESAVKKAATADPGKAAKCRSVPY